jgi:hypothetical protein
MIPREILKKIRQIKLRTNRLVSETLAGVLFQPSAQFDWILVFLPDGNNFHQLLLLKNREVNGIWPTDDFHLVGGRRGFSVTKRIGSNLLEIIVKHHGKAATNARLPRFIPVTCRAHFIADGGLNYEAKSHFLTPYRANISARSCSQGIPCSGCARASAARRSSSAICSVVRPPSMAPNSSSIVSTSSRRSASGMRRNSSRISALLMESTLPATKPFASA